MRGPIGVRPTPLAVDVLLRLPRRLQELSPGRGRGVVNQYACVPLIGSIFSLILRHRGALFEGRAYRRSHRIQGRPLSHHIFACKNFTIGAGDIVAPGIGAVGWCDTLTGWWCGYEPSSPINPTSPLQL